MMTQQQIDASIAALEPAPAGETLEQIAVRASHWLLGTIEDEHPAIAQTRALYSRAITGDMPAEAEWKANIADLASALDLALALARALASALDLARALASALDLDLARAITALLGDRLAVVDRLDAVLLSTLNVPGNSLDMDAYHTCDTTHCRAGWAITLHPMGAELERVFGPWLAGAVIYLRSTGSVPDFFASDATALADIKRAAGA